MRIVARVLLSTTLLASCSVFSESMRTQRAQDGTVDAGAAGDDAGDDAGEVTNEPEASLPAECVLSLPATNGGADGCPGKASALLRGGNEVEPNDTSPTRLVDEVVVCGIVAGKDVDTFSTDVSSGDCLQLDADGDATIQITGAGIDERISGSGTVRFGNDATGSVRVSVTSPDGTSRGYRVVVR
jgi:hypothetical protein